MTLLWSSKLFNKNISLIFFIICLLLPATVWSAGFQEEKLFDGDFYTAEELRHKIESHEKEIETINAQIKALETDIDWMVLKINQIQDSGRTAPSSLKDAIPRKEKKINTLLKNKNRLEYLVQYYSTVKGTNREKELDEILKNKMMSLQSKTNPPEKIQSSNIDQPMITVKDVTPKASMTSQSFATPMENDLDQYDGVSQTELMTAINKAGLSDWVEVVGTGSCLRLETTLPILFPTGSAKVAEEYKDFFKKLAEFLKPYDVKVQVNGYADTVPIKNKKYPSNFELGATRAANIVHQMVGYGLKPSIFSIESTGKYRFAAKGMSDQKTLERRAEVTVIFSG